MLAGTAVDEEWVVFAPVLPPTRRQIVERPEAAAAALIEAEPCGQTVEALLGIRHDRVSDAGLLDLLEASERQLAALQAHQQELLAEVARRDPAGERFLPDEAALALKRRPGHREAADARGRAAHHAVVGHPRTLPGR